MRPSSAAWFPLSILLISGAAHAQEPGVITLPDSLVAAGSKVNWVKKLPYYCEGPAADQDGNVFFTQQMSNSTQEWPIWKINPDVAGDTGTVFLRNSTQANGIMFDKNWRMVVCQNQKITRFETGGATTVLTSSGNTANFGQANDLSVGSSGAIYFTDLGSNIYYMDAAGKTKIVYSQAQSANGIEWFEEKSQLYVNQGGGLTRFQAADDGSLSNPATFVNVNGPDGGCVDAHGNFYVASYSDGILNVFNAAAQKLGTIVMTATGAYDSRSGKQGNTDNCGFGGPENKTLYITGDGGLYSVKMKVAGRRIPGMATGLAPGFEYGRGMIRAKAGISLASLLAGDLRTSNLGVNLAGRAQAKPAFGAALIVPVSERKSLSR
jgi:gluconolactonase